MLKVGIVGDIGSGKTEVLRLMRDLGAEALEADAIARDVVRPGSEALRAIGGRFGRRYVRPNGTLDRAALGRLVFSDESARQALNEIMYPAIRERMAARIEELRSRERPPDVVAFEAAVLKEMNALALADVVVRVEAPREARLERIRARNGLPDSEAQARLAAQERIALSDVPADFVIENDGDLDGLRHRVRDLWRRLHALTSGAGEEGHPDARAACSSGRSRRNRGLKPS
ncbi:MAG: dephospho-CoA kinase [Armatimonadota bacterium]